MLSYTEENYLKALLMLSFQNEEKPEVGTNDMAAYLGVKPATATDMLKKLKEKELVLYEKYGKILLSDLGRKKATAILRKHRLWETFLYKKLDFSWDEVHEVAEQLEHIQSEKLVNKLEEYLDFPEFDPHGDPIPKANGDIPSIDKTLLSAVTIGEACKVVAVKDTSALFLQYLEKLKITIGTKIKVTEVIDFDGSLNIQIENAATRSVSMKFADSLFVKR
ncbi:metal-dependent transcriptional regulator [Pedobacter hiemivivus]|jgi:DtxR family Mn-dependent transcriptional regulator|uniref:Transcriptional regulator MntR n=1 Tax=Pedobacter hiemivivus TaxID=2530454 RepID=A0A4U1GBI3_9SPHI|nr:metal-dependent transcriptional regulator [Pedobacter hiemivivus]TCC95564.1 metal-dependent transcriptional regulator [Pedobacter hiemivivus]TKC61014.1 metal-dependent transcriptional regulator [Pedobacter hiemivivus]